MSKIGRKPIELNDVQVKVEDNKVTYKGKNASGDHILPQILHAELIADGKKLKITCAHHDHKNNILWGLHRALLANEIQGARQNFVQELIINGLGFKAVLSGNKLIFSLGYSHKIDVPVPQGISVQIDKTGQNIKISGHDKYQVGQLSSLIRKLRPPEPYKGTGIKLAQETIMRKAGKAKAAA